MLLGLSLSSNSATLNQIKERGYLIVGVRDDLQCMGYLDEAGKNAGFEIEMAHNLAQAILGDSEKVKFVPVKRSQRIVALLTDKIDLLSAYLVATHAMEKAIDFGEPYLYAFLGIASPDKNITEIEQLKDKKTVVLDKGSAELYFRYKHPNYKLGICTNFSQCSNMYNYQDYDAVVNDFLLCLYGVRKII